MCLFFYLDSILTRPDAQEMVAMGKEQAGFRVPGFVIKTVIKMVQQSVLKRAKMDINKLKPIENVDKCVWAAPPDSALL